MSLCSCLADISWLMVDHQLKHQTERLSIAGDLFPHCELVISLSVTAHNLGITPDNRLSILSYNISHLCLFPLYNIPKICPLRSTQAAQVLVQSRNDKELN